MKIKYLIGLLFMALTMLACQKPVEYPIEPKIAYEGFTYLFDSDSTFSGEGIISFTYTDGDGDLGLDDSRPILLTRSSCLIRSLSTPVFIACATTTTPRPSAERWTTG